MVDYSRFSNIDASDDDEPEPRALAPQPPKPPRSKRARRRQQLADLAADEEIQLRFGRGYKSSHDSTEDDVLRALQEANALARLRRHGDAVAALKTCANEVDPLSWELHDALGTARAAEWTSCLT